MLPNVLPVEASHSFLDILERALLLITFDSSFKQELDLSMPTMDQLWIWNLW